MRKLKTKIGAMIASAMLAVAMMAMPASAGNSYGTGVAGGTTKFNKYLVIDEGDLVPELTFAYSIQAGTAISADIANNKVAVYAGPVVKNGDVVTAPTVGTAAFTSTDTAATTVATGDSVTLTSGKAYAKKEVSIDFSGVKFTEPGVYRYILTEQEITDAKGISYDTQLKDTTNGTAKQRILDVYVTDNSTTTAPPALAVSGYVLHELAYAPTKDATGYGTHDTDADESTTDVVELADKSDGFVNSLTAYDLEFGKNVNGNQASHDKYFAVTVTLNGVLPNTSFVVSYADDSNRNTKDGNADINIAANPNAATTVITSEVVQPTTISVPNDKTTVSQTFYVQHGQSIVIRGIPTGTQYTITENEEDYKPSVKVNNDDRSDTNSASGTISEDTLVSFINTRNGVIPTGVLLSVAPWVIAGIVIIGGIVFFAIRSRKKYEEE